MIEPKFHRPVNRALLVWQARNRRWDHRNQVRSNFHVASKHVLFEFVVYSPPELVELGSIGRPTIINALKFVPGLQGGPIEHQDRPDPLVIVARQGGEVCGDPSRATEGHGLWSAWEPQEAAFKNALTMARPMEEDVLTSRDRLRLAAYIVRERRFIFDPLVSYALAWTGLSEPT
jgi:hypothetical protein